MSDSEKVPSVPREEGNTKASSPCYNWCFTWFEPSDDKKIVLTTVLKPLCKILVFQEEKGESGRAHFQGVCSLKKKQRFTAMKKILEGAHFERCKSLKKSILYCQKTEGRISEPFVIGVKIKVQVKDPLSNRVLYPFQKTVLDIIATEPDDRTIHWFWEKNGNVGKSSLCKHICLNYPGQVIIVNGKQSDMFNGILSFNESVGNFPTIVLIDIPRSMSDYVSWGGIEKIKDGLFYSGKYEGGMCVFNCPHVICFGNSSPNIDKMSHDRWKINKLDKDDEESDEDP